MSEHLPSNPINSEQLSRGHEALLHNRTVELDPDLALYDKEQARSHFGINGNVLSIIELPAGAGQKEGKKLALVDFGEFSEGEEPVVFWYTGEFDKPSGKVKHDGPIMPAPAQSRFGLVGINYRPQDLLAAYAPLYKGKTLIGRELSNTNYVLGIRQDPSDAHISRKHLSIDIGAKRLRKKPMITLNDHSSNGTLVTLPNQ